MPIVAAGADASDANARLAEWYRAVGIPEASESFGAFLARTARVQHGVTYDNEIPPPGEETLRVNLDAFECVTFIESAMAVARCAWGKDATERCFRTELEASRYRDGEMGDYSSRLHYFVDWIADNESRGRLDNLTAAIGGTNTQKDFFHISRRVLPKAALPEAFRLALTTEVVATEAALSEKLHPVLERDAAPSALRGLTDGDIVAIVRERSGLLVHHAGFIYWAEGRPRLLHASSFHQRVVITVEDVAEYLLRRPERRGAIVARPLPPAN